MKLSEQWLREWVNPPLSSDGLAEQLTMAGFEVDAVESCKADFQNVIVCRVEEIKSHPNADRLKICKVSTGEDSTSVISGAGNILEGAHFVLALPGAIMPDGTEISETELKGISSSGMLCSGAELGLSTDSDKLFELHCNAKVGAYLSDYLGLEDHVFDLSLTPNRGDCFSVAGIARELGVLNDMPLRGIKEEKTAQSIELSRKVSIKDTSACPRYIGRIIKGIDLTQRAPDWILERLRRSDLRSINTVVDLTNYVMLELGQPMHAFDDDKLCGEIVVRMAKKDEELILLDGQHCDLMEGSLLITDDSGAIALAGIMGGLETAVSEQSSNIFLESAFFSPDAIAGKARSYGLHTDASLRYERGVDFELQEKALERLSQLIIQYCGGAAGPIVIVEDSNALPVRTPVNLEMRKISRLLGVDIETTTVIRILSELGLGVEENATGFVVNIPSFRFDISIEEDLIEEVARIYGYDKMPSTPLLASMRMHDGTSDDVLVQLQQCLVNRGYNEIISYSFLDKKIQEKVMGAVEAIPLLNPISSDLGVMRLSLLSGLLQALSYNVNRQQGRVRLFESGRVFRNEDSLLQNMMIGGILSGNKYPKQWDRVDIASDLYDLKSDIAALLDVGLGEEDVEYRAFPHPALHSGQSAQIFFKNQLIGIAGALHPLLMKEFDLNQPVFLFELDLSLISSKKRLKFRKPSKFPVVKRDISVLVGKEIAVEEVIKCIKSEANELLTNLELFDLYQGEGIDIEKKSLALGLTFQASSSTLTEVEVESVIVRILNTLYSEFGATLRE